MIHKIAFISDIHGNVPALKAVLEDIETNKCSEIINLGDSIAIGPNSKEVLDILNSEAIESMLGNHESYYIHGLERQSNMHPEEREHQKWIHAILGKEYKRFVQGFPLYNSRQIEHNRVLYLHYPSITTKDNYPEFRYISKKQDVNSFRKLFSSYEFDVVVFGHHHVACCVYDEEYNRFYINSGAVGCSKDQCASYVIVNFEHGEVKVQHKQVKYDRNELVNEMINRKLPEYENLLKWFYNIEI